MSEPISTILVATDHYRAGSDTRSCAIELAKRLGASVRMIYMVNVQDLRVFAPGPPTGELAKRVLRGSRKEILLVEEGRHVLESFSSECQEASVEGGGEVLVGSPRQIWAEEGRSCDLIAIRPVKEDFRRLDRLLGSKFWAIAREAERPTLLFQGESVTANEVELHLGGGEEAMSALHWAADFATKLEASLTVHSDALFARHQTGEREFMEFLKESQISASFKSGRSREAMRLAASTAGGAGLLAFDRSFGEGLWLGKRRFLERLMRTCGRDILLLP